MEAQREGWKNRGRGGRTQHFCLDCLLLLCFFSSTYLLLLLFVYH